MIIEINERQAILLRAACHTEYMKYKYEKKVENAQKIAEEYRNLNNKITKEIDKIEEGE